jgi:DNA-nicking Smr family endonuclease
MEPIEIPVDGVLDLHTFSPKEVSDLLQDYIELCREKGILEIRIIHGKGQGIQKARVHALLSRNSMVSRFRDAPPESGGWGATVVTLVP